MFIIGVLGKDAINGHALSPENMELLGALAEDNGLDADIVFAVEDVKFAGEEKKVKLVDIKKERGRLVQQINEASPEFVFCFGRIATSAAFGKGSVTLDNLRRRAHRSPDFGGDVYVCDSLQRLAAQPGIRKWLTLDIAAAINGWSETVFGDYTILLPGTEEWHVQPRKFGSLVGFDLETFPGLNPHAPNARIRMAMISDKEGEAYVVQAAPDSSLPEWLVKIMSDPTTVKAGSNIAFDARWCSRFGYELSPMLDTSTAEHVLDCTDPNKGLKWLTLRYLPRLGDYSRDTRDLLIKLGGKDRWDLLKDQDLYTYAGADAEASFVTAQKQLVRIQEAGLQYPHALMCDLYPILSNMTIHGMCVDKGTTDMLDLRIGEKLDQLRLDIQAVLGPVNPNSPKQLAGALVKFIPGVDLRQNQWAKFLQADDDEEDEDFSTSKAILEREAEKHPVIGTVLAWRKYGKMHSSFVRAVLDKHLVFHGGRHFVHPNYNTSRVETYRLSSSSPNAQQIPRKSDDELLNVKSQFISRFDGGLLVNADYGQMEMRMAGMLSGDQILLEAINAEDIHMETASLMFRRPKSEITPDDRQAAKTVGFATLYGAGARTIGKQLGVHKDIAKGLIEQYFRAYPRLRRYIGEVHEEVKDTLQVQTLFGFRRSFAPPTFGNWNKWDGFRILRQAFNTKIQSPAACVIYVAMIDMAEKMALKSLMVNTTHDSLLVDVFPGEEEEVRKLIVGCMEHPRTENYGVKLTVPLAVDLSIGKTWGGMKEWVS